MQSTQPSPRPELIAYQRELPNIIGKHAGEFVVIHGSSLLQFLPTYQGALDWAYDNIGLKPFFVKRVTLEPNVAHYTRDLGPWRS